MGCPNFVGETINFDRTSHWKKGSSAAVSCRALTYVNSMFDIYIWSICIHQADI